MSNMTQTERLEESIRLHSEAAGIFQGQSALNEETRNALTSDINAKKAALQTEVDDFVNNRGQIMGTGVGATTHNLAQFFQTGGGAGFLHLKTPFKKESANMMHFHFRGYGLGGVLVDDIVAAYQYPNAESVGWVVAKGENDISFYTGSDGHVYCRLTIPSFYYLTVVVDAMRVGNGRLLTVGSCELIRTTSDVEFL